MTDTNSPLSTIKQLVDSSIEKTDDSEIRFKLRTASQLVDVVQNHHDDLIDSLEDTDLDDELQEELRDMGYIE
ncbi:hypothetical protein DV707_11325 [Halobellus limi]|jgi:hypothetical protein|uniref:Uncharacterized protein n=1 Tax=Halobellus limi TaxID=699433 RepID=A0A1H5Z6M2_9EURY|nr:hypothetical protein DV707_11325 [Halobellus limi]SEG31794.1 hypothetical protein SAMN04488133_1868 [Halobellus limi]